MVLPGYCLTIGGNGRDLGGLAAVLAGSLGSWRTRHGAGVLAGELADSSLAVNHLRTQGASEVLLTGVDRAGE